MKGLFGFFGKVLGYMGFGSQPEPVVEETPKKKSTKKAPAKKKAATGTTKKTPAKKSTKKAAPKKSADTDLTKAIKAAEKVAKAMEAAKELQTEKGKKRYMSRLQNALTKAIAEEAIDKIAEAEAKVNNYLAKQEASK